MNIDKEHFYTYEALVDWIDGVKEAYSQYVSVRSLVKTPQGRDVFMLTVTRPGKPESLKPGYVIFANVHACELAGTTQSLCVIKTLLEEYRDTLLQDIVFYIVPRMNPDGAEQAMTHKMDIRSRIEFKKRLNGLIPKDLDGDGKILSMRLKHPDGNMIEHPKDRRIMIQKSEEYPNETTYYVYDEGLIHDFTDISSVRSCVEQTDFNRNWPVNWLLTPLSGKYPFSEVEIKAMGDFLLNHPNVFAGIDFHCGSKAIFKPSSLLNHEIDPDDQKQIDAVAKTASDMTGEIVMLSGYREEGSPPLPGFGGTSQDFTYFMCGLSFFVFELGNGFSDIGMTTPQILKVFGKGQNELMKEHGPQILELNDTKGRSFYHEWKAFNHPQLGAIEIGGLETPRCNSYYMYPPISWDLYQKNTQFVLKHAGFRPVLCITSITERTNEDHVLISCTIANTGFFNTNIMRKTRKSAMNPVIVSIRDKEHNRISYQEVEDIKGGEEITLDFAVNKDTVRDQYRIKAYHPRAGEVDEKRTFVNT